MAENWYYVQSGTRHGPVTQEALQGLLSAGTLLPTDTVWKEGMSGWEMAGKVPGLMPPPSAVTPPPVTASATTPPAAGAPPEIPGALSLGKALSPMEKKLRTMVLIGAGIVFLSFFTPYFIAWATGHIPLKLNEQEVPLAEDLNNKSIRGIPFGWSFWWGILIFIFSFLSITAAILDLTMRNWIVRAVDKWVMLGVAGVTSLLVLLHIILAIFGIGLGSVTMYGKDDPIPTNIEEAEVRFAAKAKGFREQWKNGTKEQKDAAAKAAAETYVSAGSIPIGSIIALAGGALGLYASLMIVLKKK